MHPVDEITVPFSLRIEIVAERAVDERENDVSVRQEKLEVKALYQQGQDVLRPDALETESRAVVVDELVFQPFH